MIGMVVPPRMMTVNRMSIKVVVKMTGSSIGFFTLSASASAIAPRRPKAPLDDS